MAFINRQNPQYYNCKNRGVITPSAYTIGMEQLSEKTISYYKTFPKRGFSLQSNVILPNNKPEIHQTTMIPKRGRCRS